MYFTSFLIEHNMPLAVADHAGPLFCQSCDVVEQYGCTHVKTTVIVKELASSAIEDLITQIGTKPFSIACDRSNDSDHKLYPLIITFFNSLESVVENRLLSIPDLIGDETGQNICSLILIEFEKSITIENRLSLMADNAAVMQNKKKWMFFFFFFLKGKNPNVISLGCSYHFIYLAAEKRSRDLSMQYCRNSS